MESKVVVPAQGEKIILQNGKLNVPENSTIPYIEGDGIGVDVAPAILEAVDAVVGEAYKGERKVSWMKIHIGEKSIQVYGQDVWLPVGTLDLIHEYRVAIKGPLITSVGGGIRSLNVALRQELDLYTCSCPVCYYQGIPSLVKYPELTDMVIFCESSEDIYAGIEWKTDSVDAGKVIKFLREEMGVKKIRFPEYCGVGIKPCSEEGTKRLARAAIEYAIANDRDSVTLVHKGSIMKLAEGASKDWGYQLAREGSGGELIDSGPWLRVKSLSTGKKIVIKDVIVDALLQQILLRPVECDVIVCMSLNGDYISGVLAAQIGGIGIAPGASISDECALSEATCGTAPKYAGQDRVNPGSIILSVEMMLCHMGWAEAANLTVKSTEGATNAKTVTYDFERLMEDVKLLECSEFGDVIVKNM